MKNVTVAVHDRTYRLARIWAAEHGISLSHAFGVFLEEVTYTRGLDRLFPLDGEPIQPGERYPTRGPLPPVSAVLARLPAQHKTPSLGEKLRDLFIRIVHVKL